MKLIFSALMTLSLMGCAFGKDNSSVNKAQIKENSIIDNTYGPLVGTYSGTMTTSNGPQDVSLAIYILSQPITNTDGTPGVKKVPYAHFKLISPVADDFYLSLGVTGNSSTDFVMTNTNNTRMDQVSTIEARIDGQKITGPVQSLSGTLGYLNLTLSSRQTDAPSNGIDEDRRDRLNRIYHAVAGEYVGQIKSPNPKVKPIPVSIALTVFSTANTMPSLAGYYRRLDAPEGVIDLALNVEYNADTNPPRITMDGKGAGSYALSIDGVILNDQITADITSLHQGYLGQMVLKKK